MALVAFFCLSLPQISAAVTATELFSDGNRLFHDDLYWAALLRYSQASDAGMDTPLLDYNTGVTHYRAKQYARANEALLKASRYGPLRSIAHYNLGLNAYRMGDTEAALSWFRSARDQQQDRDISDLANAAIRALQEQNAEPDVMVNQRLTQQQSDQLTNFDLRILVGAGVDDNVYQTPGESYVDLTDPARPTIDPVVQSGMFIPVSLNAVYQVNSLEHEGFFAAYRFAGKFYQDQILNQADEFLQELAFGSEYRRSSEGRERRVYSAFKIAQHDEIYYDPDTGTERIVGGVDISDRMSYLRYGPEFWMRETFGALSVGVRVKGQLWNYEEPVAVPAYDHEFWSVGVNTQYDFTPTSLIRLTAEYYTRRFSDRPAYELNGSQPAGGPTVRYDYVEAGISARQRITDSMWLGLNYRRTSREDRHVGYYDYDRDEYSAEYHLQLGQRFEFEVNGLYRIYDYQNAFAFNVPTAGRKTLEVAQVSVLATYKITDSLALVGEYMLRNVVSNDPRLDHDRGIFMLAVRWSP